MWSVLTYLDTKTWNVLLAMLKGMDLAVIRFEDCSRVKGLIGNDELMMTSLHQS